MCCPFSRIYIRFLHLIFSHLLFYQCLLFTLPIKIKVSPNKAVIIPVTSTAMTVESILSRARPMDIKIRTNAPVQNNSPTRKRANAAIKEKRLLFDCCSSALINSIIAKNISTRAVTTYFCEKSFPATKPTTKATPMLATG